MGMWMAVFTVYVIARKKDWKISEWLEIILAGMGLFLILHL